MSQSGLKISTKRSFRPMSMLSPTTVNDNIDNSFNEEDQSVNECTLRLKIKRSVTPSVIVMRNESEVLKKCNKSVS